MKKLFFTLVCLISLVLGMVAQEPIKTWSVGMPPAATVVGATYGNVTGTATTIYYWVVSTYTGGSILYPYSVSVTGITSGDPSGAHPIVISWNPINGPTGYSVVETSTPDQPSFPCGACLVGTVASSVTYYSDTGAGYTAFSPTMIKPATGDMRLNNVNYATPAFEYTINGTTAPLSTVACVGSPGNTVGMYRTQCQTSGATPVVYACKNTAGCTTAADWYALAGSGSFVTLSGDATSTAVGGATVVKGANSVLYSSLATGILKNTMTTGVPSIAVAADFPMLGVAQGGTGLATLAHYALYAGNTTSAPVAIGPDASTTKALFSAGSSANPAFRAIAETDLPVVPIVTPSTTPTLVGPKSYAICTGTCTVTVPVPVAGYDFCVYNDDNVATAITLSALGSSAMYENSARTAYGTAGTGTLVVSAAAANKVCIVGRDSTHYLTVSYNGTITVN